jgi:hypothetical protein
MGTLRPIGSEKLQGMDKINRILEISNYKLNTPNPINEDTSIEYKKTLSDGNVYHIVKEKSGYVIKKGLNESVADYIEPMKNRKYYSSYSHALKRLNLISKEVNVNEGYEKNVSLFESDDVEYVLKVPGEQTEQATPQSAPQPAQPTPPPPAPTEEPLSDMGDEEMPQMGDEDMPEMDGEEEMTEPEKEEGDEQITFKTIQKLTGKLGQKIRQFLSDEENEMSSKDIKYVINSILSALNLDSLDEEDKEEIVGKFEGEEMGGEEMYGDEEMPEPEMGDEEMPEPEMGGEEEMPEPEMGEDYNHGAMRDRQSKMRRDRMFDDLYNESTIDKVLSKYFQDEKIQNNKTIKTIERISETYRQQNTSINFVNEYPNAKLVGRTKKNNLVFELNENRVIITPKGNIL